MLCPARMEVCIRPDGVGQQPQEWNIVMSQPNFDPNHNPYQQNPQPNQGQYQQPYPPGQPIYVTQQTNDVSTVAMWGHLSGLLGGFIIPLVIWAIYKDKPGYELARRAGLQLWADGIPDCSYHPAERVCLYFYDGRTRYGIDQRPEHRFFQCHGDVRTHNPHGSDKLRCPDYDDYFPDYCRG